MAQKKAILVIMDGWGLGKVASADAIQHANVPFTRSLYLKYPHTTLTTFGELVGLPEGQMGNSEVGHLNLGAGRIVYQELQRINVAVKDGSLASNPKFQASLRYARENNKPLHLLGLVSDGGVHSHIKHLKAIVDYCREAGLSEVYIHAFTDGRDCDPKSGLGFIRELQAHLNQSVGKIATVSGRYYAMDRDKRWERTKKAKGETEANAEQKAELAKGKILVKDAIADITLQQVLTRPDEFDVIATMNLNGDYLSDALAAQVGGIGIAPGANINYATGHAIFEATHGTAPKYANLDQVNPGSVILSGEMMLRYMGWTEAADLILKGMDGAIAAKTVTYDFHRMMEGATKLKCSEFGQAIVKHMG